MHTSPVHDCILMSTTPIFSLRVPEVFEALETSTTGLTNAEAE